VFSGIGSPQGVLAPAVVFALSFCQSKLCIELPGITRVGTGVTLEQLVPVDLTFTSAPKAAVEDER
jgi:hypothetical protein